MPRHVTKRKLTAAVVTGVFVLGAGLAACGKTESTASLLAEAKNYQQKGDQKAALIQLKNAVAKSPEDGEARLLLGSQYLDMGDAVSADKELHKALSVGVAKERVLPLLARALEGQGQFQKVLDEIPLEQAKGSAPLLTLRGNAYLALANTAQAKQSYDAALALQPASGDALIGLARHAALASDLEGARRYTTEATVKDPNNPEVWMFKGTLLRTEAKQQEALAAFDQALKLKPDHRSANLEKAYIEISTGKYDAAKADIDAAAKRTPGSLMVTYTQALLEFTQNKNKEARDSLQKVLRNAPAHMPSILLAGAVELNLGSNEQAERHLRKYLESNPDNIYARKLLAQALLKSAHPGDAALVLAPALKAQSQDPQLLALAGESYLQARDFGKATAMFQQASALAPDAAALHTALGMAHLGGGDQAKGVSELELGASLAPKSMSATMALVRAQVGAKQFDKALATLQNLEQQQPNDAQVHNLKGAVYLSKGDARNARASFEKAVALQPTYFAAVANLARMDVQAGQPEAAKKRLQAVLEKDAKNFGAMSALAEIALAQNRPEEATTWLEKSSQANPDAIIPALQLGAQYLRTKQPQKAVTLARKLQTANPTNPELLDLLGQAQMASNDHAGALETYSKLVNVAPKAPLAQVRLAGVHAAMKNDSAASDDLKRAVELQPDFLPARLAQIALAMRKGKPDEALELTRQLQKQTPTSASGFILEGDLQLNLKKPALALPAYEKAWALAQSPQLLIKIAEVMKQTGKAREAEARVAQWQKQNPADLTAALYMADQQLRNKEYKPAIARLEDILKRNPAHPVALNNLAWAYQQEKDPRALAIAEQALKATPDSPAVMDTLGWLLAEQGNTARALPLLQKASALAPNAPEIHYHLAVALSKSGDKAGARKELDKLLSGNNPFPHIEEARALLKGL